MHAEMQYSTLPRSSHWWFESYSRASCLQQYKEQEQILSLSSKPYFTPYVLCHLYPITKNLGTSLKIILWEE